MDRFTKQKHPQTWGTNMVVWGGGEGGREGMVWEIQLCTGGLFL